MRTAFRVFLIIAALVVAGVLVWQGITARGNPNPTAPLSKPRGRGLCPVTGVTARRRRRKSSLRLWDRLICHNT